MLNLNPKLRSARHLYRVRRKGAVIVWTSVVLMSLIAMVGLVVDCGLMMSSFRHAQNAADAAAMAAAMDLLYGKSNAVAVATGTTYAKDAGHNNLPNAIVTINIPPASGPYAGLSNYAEAIVSSPLSQLHTFGTCVTYSILGIDDKGSKADVICVS